MATYDRPSLLSRPTGATAPAGVDRTSRLAWWDVQRTTENRKLDATTDPTHSHWIHKFHFEAGPTFLRGRVIDSVAYTNCYKVQFGMWGTMWCQMMVATALQPMGARQLGQLPVGASVMVLWYQEDNSGVIVGVLPDAQISGKLAMPDFISQQARSGLLVDAAHHYPVCLPDASHIIDWSAGRPFDATTEGESGHITETGILSFIDSFMTAHRVDEMSGVWSFWTDELTRVAGHNLQVWSAGAEREDTDDEGEFDKIEGHTPYYWEALGAFEFGTNVSRDIKAECWQKDPKYQGYSAVEPCDDHQLPFYRLRDFYGYFGQAHKRVLCLPPHVCSSSAFPTLTRFGDTHASDCCSSATCDLSSSCSPEGLNLLHTQLIYPGVFDEDLALTGRWAVRSAHEIILSKHILIPAPKQMILPQDPRGDSAEDYRAAGHPDLGNGQPHKVVGEIEVQGDDNPTQIRALGFLDTHAFVFNWIGEHPFHYHIKDWLLPEESELHYLARDCHHIQMPPPSFDELQCYQFLDAPPAIPIKVDHRYGKVNYYPNHSYFALLADGGSVWGDGFGAEIKMANGSIDITAPGDISLKAGRSLINLAGKDFEVRAKNSWDISATNHDGRLKAKRNLWMVASGKCGGILIQSKAKKPYCDFNKKGEEAIVGGIVIKAEDSLITTCAKDLAFKLTKTDEEEHVIVFDTGWKGRFKVKTKFFERFMSSEGAALDFWVTGSSQCKGKVNKGTEHWREGTLFCSPVVINDKLLVGGCIGAQGDIVSTKGHIITKGAKKTHGKVGELKGPQSLETALKDFKKRCEKLTHIGNGELNTLCLRNEKYACCDAEFSFRTVKQYGTKKYVMFEARWQQLARVGKVKTKTWREEEVNGTYPYPGKEVLLGRTFRTLDPKLYRIKEGYADKRGVDYHKPSFRKAAKKTLDSSYTVVS